MKILHSRKGFTLIELLVVIGILAVLAAIAIPTVAGLIDRSNVSADSTNATEYTNAMERFVSEYELYRQDIASGLIKDTNGDGTPDNLDSAQSRVYNVTGAKSMEDIRVLEGPMGLNGIRIDIDNKYAQNTKTAKKIIENYTKTSSSTFEPKQSDMTYWYHMQTGYTIVAPKNANTEILISLLPTDIPKDDFVYFQSAWVDLGAPLAMPEVTIRDVTLYDYTSSQYILHFHTYVPNPKYVDVNYHKMYFITNAEEDGELTMETATEIRNMGDRFSDENLQKMENSVDLSVHYWVVVKVNKNPVDMAKTMQSRVAYEYEENGEVKYAYTPVQKASVNELLAAGKMSDVH